MNYLAHLYLAEPSDDGLLGSLLGDFVKGRPDTRLRAGVRRGILLHRAIDSYTDAHPLHRASRNRISPLRRRYAGIIVDVCYDHFLCRRWERYSNERLERFSARVYDLLARHHDVLPPRLARLAPRMIAHDWLGSYAELDNVGRALDGISRRLSRENPLAGALIEVEDNYAELERDFRRFFPELARAAIGLCADLRAREPPDDASGALVGARRLG
ncbi:MAG: ACP phosphodiesterase [Gammaproteobacteria bacterium]|nr:ACP phosphodiesterase [Gammaproteobacteria bacterium]